MALDVHAQDVRGVLAALVGVARELDAAGLPAPADLHLGLDDDRIADAIGRGDRGVDRLDGLTRGDRDAVLREQLLALIFEQVQRIRAPA